MRSIRKNILLVSLIFVLFVFSRNTSAHRSSFLQKNSSAMEKYKKKGLSQIEWEMIRDAKMPEYKVDELLKSGISIIEYFNYPWLKHNMTEKMWIKKRRAGIIDDDMGNISSELSEHEGKSIIKNFFLPGYHQFKRNQKLKGSIMTFGSIIGFGLTAGASIYKKEFYPQPFLFIMLPAMLWSSMDIGFQIHAEQNPAAKRFSVNYNKTTIALVATLPIKKGLVR